MKRMFLAVLILSFAFTAEAKATYYRFAELNKYREFAGSEQVVEGEAKKIECFQFKYDKSSRPVEIKHLTKMTESEGDFAGLGSGISMLSIEYKDSIYSVYDTLSGITYKYKMTESRYKAFNSAREQVPFRGNVYMMVHLSTRRIIDGNLLERDGYNLLWKNYGKDSLLCDDYLGVKIYLLEFINNGGLSIVKSTRLDENNNPITDSAGVDVIEFQYSDAGQLVFQTFKEKSGSRVNNEFGYCELRIARTDSNGMFAETFYYFDKDGNPAVNKDKVFAVKYFYDENKYLTSYLNCDSVGKAMASADKVSYVRTIRDNYFFIEKIEYFTSVKDPIKKTPPQLKVEGNPMFFLKTVEYKYDDRGIMTEKIETDLKNKDANSGRQ